MSKKDTDNSSDNVNEIWPSVKPKDPDQYATTTEPELTKEDIEKINEERLTTYVPYWIQSLLYVFSATLWQFSTVLNQPELGTLTFRFIFSGFLGFGLPSWLLLTFALWFVEKNKPKEARSNTLLFLSVGFILLAIVF